MPNQFGVYSSKTARRPLFSYKDFRGFAKQEGMVNDPLQRLADQMIPAGEQEMKIVLKLGDNISTPFYGMMHYHMGWVDGNFKVVQAKSGTTLRLSRGS